MSGSPSLSVAGGLGGFQKSCLSVKEPARCPQPLVKENAASEEKSRPTATDAVSSPQGASLEADLLFS